MSSQVMLGGEKCVTAHGYISKQERRAKGTSYKRKIRL